MMMMMVDCDHDDPGSLVGLGLKRSRNHCDDASEQATTRARGVGGGRQPQYPSLDTTMEVEEGAGKVCRYCQRQFTTACQAIDHEALFCVQNRETYPRVYNNASNKFVAGKENICFRCGQCHLEKTRYCYPSNSIDAYLFR